MQKVVQGQVTAIEPRANDWAAVHILVPGKQFPLKLSTKRQDLIGAAQQMAWQVVDALYNEEESTNINPHNGQPYVNRYLEQLAPAGQMPQPQQNPTQPAVPMPIPAQPQAVPTTGLQPQQGFGNLQPQQQMPPQPVVQNPPFPPQPQGTVRHEVVTDDARETRIMRQAATKVAAAFLPSLAEEDQNLGSLIRISEQLLKYYREGVSWTTNPPDGWDGEAHDAQQQAAAHSGDPGDPSREHDDDAFPQGY